MNLQAEKLQLIEELINLNDRELFLKIKKLLKKSPKASVNPMDLETFFEKIDASERAYERGEFVSQSAMEKEIKSWKKKEVIWTLPAKADLQNIFDYLAEISETIALRVVNSIVESTRLLEAGYTKIGQEEPLLKSRKINYRYLVKNNYKIIYREQNDTIIIHAVFHTKQNPKKLKKKI